MKTLFQRIFVLCALTLMNASVFAIEGGSQRLPNLERVIVPATSKPIANFTLTDHNGRPRSLQSLSGAPALFFFGFTHCPDICPATLTKLKLLHEWKAGALKSARIVLVSVDGERDSPAVLKKYLSSFPSEFIGLTGKPRAVADIAARFSAVAYKEQADQKGNYGYFHSTQVFVVDKDSRLRATFADASLENMAAVTKLLIDETSIDSK